jgi:curli production assembly/transport component CsgF
MNHCKSLLVKVWVLLAMSTQLAVHAGELRYTPVNPTFGGNPLNSSGLQAIASAQNDFKAPVAPKVPAPTALEKFTASIQTAIESRAQSAVVNALFDKKGFTPGEPINAGNFTITVTADPQKPGELVLVTTDKVTGGSTTINLTSFGVFE